MDLDRFDSEHKIVAPIEQLLEEGTVAYFKDLSEETGIPYQTLINLYLRDCAATGRRLDIAWKS